ncbi:hypothetical protein RJ640_009572 [Escallonia rubra]|uniref:C2H2-type domain-containing protein n=1 Tax=Escallonia rubra TaxID=112253 RepID=A0AA88R3Z9_9ASTE|nr:hypothetical protein RJ640_009572 [Escallonia rubra]
MLASQSFTLPPPELYAGSGLGFANTKKKRRPAGTPDPDAEVVSLSPETLMESDQYVCEICNQRFQREQNLQMHRRRHKVPWKLLKRGQQEARKLVYVCPEPSCWHHDPCHALGDLVGIKKHFRRKHSSHKQWVCVKCSKGYAVQSDFKAHLKNCGTKGHSCDCGRVFSRVESFIEHQDTCKAGTIHHELQPSSPPYNFMKTKPLRQAESSSNTDYSGAPPASYYVRMPKQRSPSFTSQGKNTNHFRNLSTCTTSSHNMHASQLQLSVGPPTSHHGKEYEAESSLVFSRMRDEARKQLKIAMEEKALAEEKRRQARWQIELAKQEFALARKIRQEAAAAEMGRDQFLRDYATKQATCHACKKQFHRLTQDAGEKEKESLLKWARSLVKTSSHLPYHQEHLSIQ